MSGEFIYLKSETQSQNFKLLYNMQNIFFIEFGGGSIGGSMSSSMGGQISGQIGSQINIAKRAKGTRGWWEVLI